MSDELQYSGRMSAAFTNIGSGYSCFPAATTCSTYVANCHAANTSSPCASDPNTLAQVPALLRPARSQSAPTSGPSAPVVAGFSRPSGTSLAYARCASGE